MTIRIAYIPYLNMVPFHHDFGPDSVERDGYRFDFQTMSPRTLGMNAEKETVDAGALSLVDWFKYSSLYEPLGAYGIGAKQTAQSVLLFSKTSISELKGICAVTDETSTSFRLLQVLIESRYGLSGVTYGRIASSMLFDGSSDALLLIGDEALRAKQEGIPGLPIVTDLGAEWYEWKKLPFVFARWAIRKSLPTDVRASVSNSIQNSLNINNIRINDWANGEAAKRHLTSPDVQSYWQGFAYELTADHEKSIELFMQLLGTECLTA